MIFLSDCSERKLRAFCIEELQIPSRLVRKDLHVTVYHARRPIDGVGDAIEPINISVPVSELRAMAMAPGGENPRADIDPTRTSVGIRIRRQMAPRRRSSVCGRGFSRSRQRRCWATGRRARVGPARSAPEATTPPDTAQAGAIRDPDLSKFGARLRTSLDNLTFDRLVVRCRRSDRPGQRGS